MTAQIAVTSTLAMTNTTLDHAARPSSHQGAESA
jgi:hypothetical protein